MEVTEQTDNISNEKEKNGSSVAIKLESLQVITFLPQFFKKYVVCFN